MLNRAALILRYKQPFVDWINAVDPSPESFTLSLADTRDERTVYLIDAIDDLDHFQRWLARNHKWLFEAELNGWYTDPALWPRDRSLKKLRSGAPSSSTRSWSTPEPRPSKTTISSPISAPSEEGATVCSLQRSAQGR